MKTLIGKYTQNKKKLYTCFVDFRKAFDLVWHKGLLYKLRKLSVSNKFYNVIKSMYSQIKLYVRCNDNLTPFFQSDIGVQQGDSLSLILFKLFINDLPSSLGNINDRVVLGDLKFNCLLYADDLVLFSSSQGLQKSLDSLNSYCIDPYIRGSFFSALKFFRKARKKRYKEYRQQIISSLDSLHDNNPKAYLSLLEKLKKNDKDGEVEVLLLGCY